MEPRVEESANSRWAKCLFCSYVSRIVVASPPYRAVVNGCGPIDTHLKPNMQLAWMSFHPCSERQAMRKYTTRFMWCWCWWCCCASLFAWLTNLLLVFLLSAATAYTTHIYRTSPSREHIFRDSSSSVDVRASNGMLSLAEILVPNWTDVEHFCHWHDGRQLGLDRGIRSFSISYSRNDFFFSHRHSMFGSFERKKTSENHHAHASNRN